MYRSEKWSDALNCLESLPSSERDQAYYDLRGSILMRIGNMEEAIIEFERAIRLDTASRNPYLYFKWGESLWHNNQYQKAGLAMQQYREIVDNPRPDIQKQVNYFLRSAAVADSLYHTPRRFDPVLMSDSINSEEDELGLSMTYDRKYLILTRRSHQEDVYESYRRDGVWSKAKPIHTLNTRDNEGAAALSGDGQLLVFTACNRAENVGSCDLYYSTRSDTGWATPKLMPVVNSAGWDSQPTLSPDGRVVVFSSERPGGYGGRDLWLSVLGENGWIKPINLGPSINSPGDEENPFLHSDQNTLYFTSDYWPGFGGRDLFMSHRISGNKWTPGLNLGYPINSAQHEEGICIASSGSQGYFASARGEHFNLYTFEVDPDIRPNPSYLYQLVVLNKETGEKIDGATVEVYDWTENRSTRSVTTDADGYAAFLMMANRQYGITVSQEGFTFRSNQKVIGESLTQDMMDTIQLEPIPEISTMVLENVHFATGEARLLEGSEAELDQLAAYLNDHQQLSIRLIGHTDNVGTTEDNLALSSARARTVKSYLIGRGIPEERIIAEGKGESQPIATNDTPEGRQKNRRTEITIIR